jgi:hypothetical protein
MKRDFTTTAMSTRALLLGAGAGLLLASVAPSASAVALLTSAKTTFFDPGIIGTPRPLSDTVAVGAEREICVVGDTGCALSAPGTNIGGDGTTASGLLAAGPYNPDGGEYVDFIAGPNNQIKIHIATWPRLHDTGSVLLPSYLFSNFTFDDGYSLAGVRVAGLSGRPGVALDMGPLIEFDPIMQTIRIDLSKMLVPSPDSMHSFTFDTLTLDLEIKADDVAVDIPEPGTVPLLGLGLLTLLLATSIVPQRRRKQ